MELNPIVIVEFVERIIETHKKKNEKMKKKFKNENIEYSN
jgi:hypothetical protein